jgi:hypothetical protein
LCPICLLVMIIFLFAFIFLVSVSCILPVYLGAPYAFNKIGLLLIKKKKLCLMLLVDIIVLKAGILQFASVM